MRSDREPTSSSITNDNRSLSGCDTPVGRSANSHGGTAYEDNFVTPGKKLRYTITFLSFQTSHKSCAMLSSAGCTHSLNWQLELNRHQRGYRVCYGIPCPEGKGRLLSCACEPCSLLQRNSVTAIGYSSGVHTGHWLGRRLRFNQFELARKQRAGL
jgi:hypothetical protein